MCLCTCVHVVLLVPVHPSLLPAWILWSALKKKTQKIETQFGAAKKPVPWANGGSDTETYSSKIPTGVQENFCLSNISSLESWNKDFRWIYSNKGKTDRSLKNSSALLPWVSLSFGTAISQSFLRTYTNFFLHLRKLQLQNWYSSNLSYILPQLYILPNIIPCFPHSSDKLPPPSFHPEDNSSSA